MSKVINSKSILARVAEIKIQDAIDSGEFKKLLGFGKPFSFDELRYDPNWWIKNKMKREQLISELSPEFFRELER